MKLGIDDRVDKIVNKEVFIIFKDYKLNFVNKLICWLINFIKLEIGKISKRIFDRINSKIIRVVKFN